MHLFADHKALRTEALNVDFILSNSEILLSQWSFLYSRLPYLMFDFMRLQNLFAPKYHRHPPFTLKTCFDVLLLRC